MGVTEAIHDGSEERFLPAERAASQRGAGLVLSEAVAGHVGELLSLSEQAAQAIRDQARADAELLVRTATQAAAQQALAAVAGIAGEAVPRLEARVTEMRALVDGVRAELELLTEDLGQIAGTDELPQLPPVTGSAEPIARDAHERRALLIALNMAGNGASRAEAAHYLVEHLALDDHERLLDAVYGYVG
jgi:hypothetical protein